MNREKGNWVYASGRGFPLYPQNHLQFNEVQLLMLYLSKNR